MAADPRRVEDVWLAASAAPPQDRARVLAEACGTDAQLRRRVEELLRSGTAAADERMFEDDLETLLAGTTVPLSFGRYQLRGQLGRGGMGEVYEAWDPTLARAVAVKTLPELRAASDDARARFRKEIEFLGRLGHPNVVAVFDADLDADRPFVVMEKLAGRTLAGLVRDRGPLPAAEALDLTRLAAEGLAAVHAAGVLHRDVKPDNLFLTDDGRLKVIDLGVGGLVRRDAPGGTRVGLAVGTAEYVAPEQLGGEATPQSDVYALGGTLHFLLTGRPPFADLPPASQLNAHRTAPPPDLSDRHPAVAALVRVMLAKEPGERPDGMDGVQAALTATEKKLAKTARPGVRLAIPAFFLVAAALILVLPRDTPMTMDETRQLCLTLSAVAGLFGAVFGALRLVVRKRWVNALVGTAVTLMLFGLGAAIWYKPSAALTTATAPAAPRKPVSAGAEWQAVVRHLESLPKADPPAVRFVTLGPVWNRPSATDAAVADYRAALAEWAAAQVEFGGLGGRPLTPVNPEKTVFAVKLDDGLTAEAWNKRVARYEYGMDGVSHSDAGVRAAAEAAHAHTDTRLPVVRADWLLVRCGRSGAWRADFDRPLSAADLTAELGLSGPEPLTNWLAKNAEQAAKWGLEDLTRGGTVPRAALSEKVAGKSAFQALARALRLGAVLSLGGDAP